MNTLAHTGGPGPWALLFPLFRAAVVIGSVTLLRPHRVARAQGPMADGPHSPGRARTVLADRAARPTVRHGGDRRGRVLAPTVGAGRAVRPDRGRRTGVTPWSPEARP